MKRVQACLTIATLIVLFLLSSCVMQQGLTLYQQGKGGWATSDLYVYDFFLSVLEDFEPFSEEERTISIMDEHVEDFVIQLYHSPSASNISSMKIGDNGYFIDFSFSSLVDLLSDLNKKETQSIVTVDEAYGISTLRFYLDIDNYEELERMIPFLSNPNFETFGPLYNEGMSEEEYLDMMSYILGDEAPPSIEQSLISLRFTTPKAIKSLSGGVQESPNSVRFDIPLIDFLLLAEPIVFSVSW